MKRGLAVLTAAMLLTSSGCAMAQNSKPTIDLYYVVSADSLSGTAIDCETRTMEEVTVPAVMAQLLQEPAHTTRLAAFAPTGTTLQNWSVEGGTAYIDLSEDFGQLSGISLTKAEYCIVLTLTQLDGIDAVSITVAGQSLPGAAAGTLSADDVVLEGETEDPATVESLLFYPLSDRSGLETETRSFTSASEDAADMASAILEQLASGPSDENMLAFLPTGGKIQVESLRQGVCTVTMDNAVLESICQPVEDYELKLYAIVDSLCQLDEVNEVRFRLNGNIINGWLASYTAKYEF